VGNTFPRLTKEKIYNNFLLFFFAPMLKIQLVLKYCAPSPSGSYARYKISDIRDLLFRICTKAPWILSLVYISWRKTKGVIFSTCYFFYQLRTVSITYTNWWDGPQGPKFLHVYIPWHAGANASNINNIIPFCSFIILWKKCFYRIYFFIKLYWITDITYFTY